MRDKIKFKKYMAGLGELFDKKISDILKDIYWKSLMDISDEEAEKGFNLAFTSCKFFPKPAELLELMRTNPAIEDKALVAANNIVSHLKFNGAGKRPDLSGDPVAHYLMTTRWNYPNWASQVLESELKWWIKEFCEAYRAYTTTDGLIGLESPEALKELIDGMMESV